MSNNPEISILVPCCNVERFVRQCLESIQRQTFTNFEVICLNDGSRDNTLSEIKAIADNDKRFIVIDKPNTGYGATMNLGLSLARGRYIGIVESDDFIEPKMYESLYTEIDEKKLDYVRCCYYRLEDGKDNREYSILLPKGRIYKPIDTPRVFKQSPSIWAALYRADFLKNNDIKFLETPGAAFQDTSFAFKVALMSNRVSCLDVYLLHYRIHGDNSVKKSGNVSAIFKEYDESYRYACDRGLGSIVSTFFLELEYEAFKWNFYRLNDDVADVFLREWRERWRKSKGYGVRPSNIRMYLKYLRVVLSPWFLKVYLLGREKK